jgi:nucleotide-binding universal stress UspA family protein
MSGTPRSDAAHSYPASCVLEELHEGEKCMKILLATDGSTFSEAAIRAVASQLRTTNAEVLVLRVVEPLVYSTPPQMAAGYAPETAARLKDELKQASYSVALTAETLRNAGFKADSRVEENEVRTGILAVAEAWRADLIVLGSHGEKGLRKFLLGSVAEFVARHARCSVLIVRTPSAG